MSAAAAPSSPHLCVCKKKGEASVATVVAHIAGATMDCACSNVEEDARRHEREVAARHRADFGVLSLRVVPQQSNGDAEDLRMRLHRRRQPQNNWLHDEHSCLLLALRSWWGGEAASVSDYSSLRATTALVETAMLAAVSGLAYLVATILKLENTVGYFLPLPVVLAALRSGQAVGWKTMGATAFLLVVLLGPLRAVSYLLLHGLVAATLGSLWSQKVGWTASVAIAALVRLAGQLSYLVLSSVTMNENFFWVVLNNVYSLLDQVSAAVGAAGSPSTTAVTCMLFSLLLVNSVIYVFLLHVVYRLILQAMGFELGALPGFVQKYLYAGMSPEARAQLEAQAREAAAAKAARDAERA
ncbi:hypothetical protein FOA52_013675 [Chlamydomonas sp. UWO 241]|nr:hypothetical protein FOA52_013675 [Chlamydomonas sp. UWO 241]